MTEPEWRRRTHPASRRVIDLAIGILMGLRACSEQEAFDDLVAAMHDTGIAAGALARALISLIEDSDATVPHRDEAMRRWGHLITARVTNGPPG